ncbi:MAG: O-antigen ligase family protein [Candidatus Eremiobacteraeota bacterium]|nr:O-antigen ligase family protein [Candidatus Eremiobacteraeota bacterium]
MKRPAPYILGLAFLVIPLFPSFIALTAVTIPGISLVAPKIAIGLLALMAVMGAYMAIMLLQPPRERPPTFFPLLIWFGASLLSALLGFNPGGGMLFLGIFGMGLIWHFSLLRFYREPKVASTIFHAYLFSGAVSAVLAILMVLLRAPAAQYTVGHGRAIGTFILPGELAGYLLLYLPIAWAIARTTAQRSLRILAIVGLVSGLGAFILTFSRAGWVGLAAAAAFYLFVQQRSRRYAAAFLAAGIVAVLVVFNAHHNPSENYTRISIWQAGIEIVRRFPLTGVGPFVFANIYPLVRLPDGDATAFHAHSFLLTVFAETGLIGILAVVYAWGKFVVVFREQFRRANPVQATLGLAIAAGLVGTWVQGVIDTVSVVIFGLWLPFMALALVCAGYPQPAFLSEVEESA